MSDEDVKVVTDSVLTMAEQLLGVSVGLEVITTKAAEMPQMMVQTLPCETVVRRYRCGDYIGQHEWALYLRVAAGDTQGRLDAVRTLTDAAEAVRKAVPPMPAGFTFMSTTGGVTPTMVDATEQYETYRVDFTTQYKHLLER